MAKTLCERKKALKKDPKAFAKLIDDPQFFCKKCGRVANCKKYVCKPRKLADGTVQVA
jgi:hypothetical protein